MKHKSKAGRPHLLPGEGRLLSNGMPVRLEKWYADKAKQESKAEGRRVTKTDIKRRALLWYREGLVAKVVAENAEGGQDEIRKT